MKKVIFSIVSLLCLAVVFISITVVISEKKEETNNEVASYVRDVNKEGESKEKKIIFGELACMLSTFSIENSLGFDNFVEEYGIYFTADALFEVESSYKEVWVSDEDRLYDLAGDSDITIDTFSVDELEPRGFIEYYGEEGVTGYVLKSERYDLETANIITSELVKDEEGYQEYIVRFGSLLMNKVCIRYNKDFKVVEYVVTFEH